MSERTEKEAGRLILSNFQMFNDAVMLFEREIEPFILKLLDQQIEVTCNEKGWHSYTDFPDNCDTWFCPKNWLVANPEDEEDYVARFDVIFLQGWDDELSSLDSLCGINDKAGLGFRVNMKKFSSEGKWNSFAKEQALEINSDLSSRGFEVVRNHYVAKHGAFFLPFKLDMRQLADAWENESYELLMQPVAEAMNTINSTLPVFQGLLDRAERKFRS